MASRVDGVGNAMGSSNASGDIMARLDFHVFTTNTDAGYQLNIIKPILQSKGVASSKTSIFILSIIDKFGKLVTPRTAGSH